MRRKGVALYHEKKLQTKLKNSDRPNTTSQNEKKRLIINNRNTVMKGLTQEIQRIASGNEKS